MSLKPAFLLLTICALCGCGVKGKPLPPLEPMPIGDGTLAAQKKNKTVKPVSPTTPREEINNQKPAADSL